MDDGLTRFERTAPAHSDLPVLLRPASAGESLLDAYARLGDRIESHLAVVGGVLLRGFGVPTVAAFREFAAAFGHPLLAYEFGSTPRTAGGGGVYTSTGYPAHQSIPLHNEQAYTREWPLRIWFHCVTAASRGGETPIADSRAILARMPPALRARFEPGVRYVRNYGGFDLPWRQVFGTERRDEVEAYCARSGIQCEWKADGNLRTVQHCQAIARHPATGEAVWFNQAHLFHVSNLQPEVRAVLEESLRPDELPRNAFFADGAPIPDTAIEDIRAVLQAETVSFRWEAGDVLMLDNMLVAHASAPFEGPRKVVVAMARPHRDLDMPLWVGARELQR